MARHGGNKKVCEKYKANNRREINKGERQEKHQRLLAKMERRRLRKDSGELALQKTEVPESVKEDNEKKRRQQAFRRLMAKTKKTKPVCTKNGALWGTDRDALKQASLSVACDTGGDMS